MPRAVIVDDERLARRELRELLLAHPAVIVVGEAETLGTAAEVIRATEADTVFLDVQLGEESGLDLLPRLEPEVAVVFVTAHDRYAVQAFELHALDYLLKPVSPSRMTEAVRRLDRREPPKEATSVAVGYDEFLFLRIEGRMRFIKVRQLVAVTARADHTTLRLASGEAVEVRKPIGEWETRLPATRFVRVHRSAIVNLDYVERLEDWSHASFQVYLRGQPAPLSMSRRYAAALRERLG